MNRTWCNLRQINIFKLCPIIFVYVKCVHRKKFGKMSVSDRLSLFMYSSTLLQYDFILFIIFFLWIMLRMNYFKEAYTLIHHEYLLSNHSVLLINISLYSYIFDYFSWVFKHYLRSNFCPSQAGTLLVGLSNMRYFLRVGGRLVCIFYFTFFPVLYG